MGTESVLSQARTTNGEMKLGIRPPRRIPATFSAAGGLMSAGTLLLAAGGLTEARFAYVSALALIPLAFVAVAIGLLEVIRDLRDRMRSATRVAAAAASIIGAVAALTMTLMALLMPPIDRVLWFVPYAMLASLSVALIVVGVAVRRAGLGGPRAGPYLITGGLLLLFMPLIFVWMLLMWGVPVLAVFGGLAAIFFALGSAFRTGESHSEPG